MKRTQWYAYLASAIALVLASAIALGLQLSGGSDTKDHTAQPGATECRDNLPVKWQSALRGSIVSLPQPAQPLSVDSDGTLYALTADKTIIAIDRQRSVSDLYHLPAASEQRTIRAYAAAGKLVVVTLDATGARLVRLDVVDLTSEQAKQIGVSGTSDGAAVMAGAVYWDERPDASKPGGIIRRYDLATGNVTTVAYGQVKAPETSASGVSWGSGSQPADLPGPVKAALPGDGSAITDGVSYAWTKGDDIYWAGTDGTIKDPLKQQVATTPIARAVAGSFVFFNARDASDKIYVIDADSGKVAGTGLLATGIMLSGGGVVALGGPLNGTTGTPPMTMLDTTGLPPLGC